MSFHPTAPAADPIMSHSTCDLAARIPVEWAHSHQGSASPQLSRDKSPDGWGEALLSISTIRCSCLLTALQPGSSGLISSRTLMQLHLLPCTRQSQTSASISYLGGKWKTGIALPLREPPQRWLLCPWQTPRIRSPVHIPDLTTADQVLVLKLPLKLTGKAVLFQLPC